MTKPQFTQNEVRLLHGNYRTIVPMQEHEREAENTVGASDLVSQPLTVLLTFFKYK